jgi:hypothetical protein
MTPALLSPRMVLLSEAKLFRSYATSNDAE